MKKENIRKILIIISILIIIFGIISGIIISGRLIVPLITDNGSSFMIDGTDFSFFAKLFGSISFSIIGLLVILFCIGIVLVIWIIYAIVLCMLKIIDKSKMKEENKKKVKKILIIIVTILLISVFVFLVYVNFVEDSKEEYKIIEEYILNNYYIKLTTKSMRTMDRGDMGFNPGKSYTFTMKDSNGIEYTVFVDTYDRNKTLEEILNNPKSIKGFNIEKNNK